LPGLETSHVVAKQRRWSHKLRLEQLYGLAIASLIGDIWILFDERSTGSNILYDLRLDDVLTQPSQDFIGEWTRHFAKGQTCAFQHGGATRRKPV